MRCWGERGGLVTENLWSRDEAAGSTGFEALDDGTAAPRAFLGNLSVDLGDIRAFVEAVRAGTFTAAARRLGTTQPALSRRIARLEAAIGESLFDRSNRRSPRLGSLGQAILPRAEELLADYEEFVAVLRGRSRDPSALTVVLSDFSVGYVMPELNLHMLSHPPGVHLNVLLKPPGVGVRQALVEGEAELGLMDSITLTPEFDAVPFGVVDHCAVGTEMYLGTSSDAIDWRELRQLPLLLPAPFPPPLVSRYRSGGGDPVNRVHEARTVGATIALVRAGMGVAIMAGYEKIAGLSVRPVVLSGAVQHTSIVLAWRRDGSFSSGAEALIKKLQSRDQTEPVLRVPSAA
jgi:DNA-binding transcriptional LysR family regulator